MSSFPRFCLLAFAVPLFAFALSVSPARADSDTPKRKPNTRLWKSEKEQGETAFKKHQLAEAETHLQAALAEAENFDNKDYRLAESLTELGEFYARVGRFTDAEPLLQRAAIARFGDPNPLTEANVQFLLGFTGQQLRHYDVAEKAFIRAQELYARKLGPDHPLAVRCMFYLGSLYEDQQDYSKAEPLLKRSLALFEHPAARTVNRNPGDPATHAGTQVWIGQFRPDFVYALESLVRLGLLQAKLNRAADSDSSFQRALRLIDERLAKDPAAVLALEQMATICAATGNYGGALPFIQRYTAFMEKAKGTEDAGTQAAQAELALLYERLGNLPQAEALYKKIIDEREQKYGANGDATVSAAEPLIQMYLRQQRYLDAEPLVTHQLAGIEKHQGEGLAMLPVLAEQITIYSKLGREADLDYVYQRQVSILEKTFGPKNKALVKPLKDHAALLRKLKRDSEADALEARAKALEAAN